MHQKLLFAFAVAVFLAKIGSQNASRAYVMYQKLLFAFAVAVFMAKIGTALKCNKCFYASTQPKNLQTCENHRTRIVNCSGYCFTSITTNRNGTTVVYRGCAVKDICTDAEERCSNEIKNGTYTSCHLECCQTDNCNNYTPSSATGVMATKITVFVMIFMFLLYFT
ncbi:uncharacterized skeletal organic matrix protein 2-like isoform X2 [Dendronephthya gigantea]|uniref:uncharacterized skeletal organic matrix protein 2-like isoform X2 n=1 Tax=Dendronephthya gigantea TaxID=151771 RepID=UPI00106D98BE|nr:uncharacterized skeletal organic matrix protein 2-like isoform X2 [Dendronephthya gigantea]